MQLWVIGILILVILYGIRNFPQVQHLKKWFAQWRKDRAKQKKLNEMYARLDHEGGSKFDHKAHIRMINQMKKGMKK